MQSTVQELTGKQAAKFDQTPLDPQDLTVAKLDEIVDTNSAFFDQIDTFEFNIFNYSQEVGRSVQMPLLAGVLLKKHGL